MCPATDARGHTAAELYVRSLAPRIGRDRVERAMRRLEDLAAEGTVDDVTVRVTGEAVPARPKDCWTTDSADLVGRMARFRDWADRTGRERLGFDHPRVHSSITGQDYEALVPPALCLAEYENGRLQYVSPCLEAGRKITVEQRLLELERGRAGEREVPAEARATGELSGR